MANSKDIKEYQILICLIEIWPYKDGDDPLKRPQNPLMFTEVESISIEESYRKLICGATVKFPRGTILHRTLTANNGYIYDRNVSASIGNDGILSEFKNTKPKIKDPETNEWIEVESAKLAEVSDFQVGNRITISLGYTTDYKIAALTEYNNKGGSIYSNSSMLSKYKKALTVMFEGYITQVSLDSPIELECENLASALKKITCPNHNGSSKDTVNTFFGEEKGELALLKKAGLKLYPKTRDCKIDLGRIKLTNELVVADLLDIWAQRKVYSFLRIEDGTPYVAVGRPYFSSLEGTTLKSDSLLILGEQNSTIKKIEFDFHVAKNNLSLMDTDPNLVAVEAQCLEQDNKKDSFYKIVVIRNPSYDSGDPKSKPFRVINEGKLSKKAIKMGKRYLVDNKDRIDLKKYNVIPYVSKKINCGHNALVEEAIKYLEGYNPNGIKGSLTLFGDLNITCATQVQLEDNIHSGKNGFYFVDEVQTEFGVNGYRQTIKLPYCIRRNNQSQQ